MQIHRSRRRPHRAPAGRPVGPTVYRAEPLEPRTLLAIVINGTERADTLVVDRDGDNFHVTLNGDASSVPIGGESQLRVNGLGGNDTVRVGIIMTDTVVFGTVDGGDGNDTITVGSRLDR